MFRFIIFLVLAVVVHGLNHAVRLPNLKHIKTRIVGGQNTDIAKHPYQVLLFPTDGNDTFLCGGSILDKDWVMSAAHCFVGMKSVNVTIGTSHMWSGGTKYTTSKFTMHPNYDGKTKDYDIAIIDLRDTPMAIDGKTSKPTILPAEGDSLPTGTKVTITGWGAIRENGPVSETLQEVQVKIVNQTQCNASYGNSLTSRMVCAAVPQGGKDSCQGDSGGPLVKSSDSTQVGIVSFGYGCARPGVPGVYTRVSALRKWIKDNTGV